MSTNDNTEALPPLPEPAFPTTTTGGSFDHQQMRDYVRAALAQRQQVPAEWTMRLDADAAETLKQTIGDDDTVSEITLSLCDGHEGRGLYVWLTEYPEEGSLLLAAAPALTAAPSAQSVDDYPETEPQSGYPGTRIAAPSAQAEPVSKVVATAPERIYLVIGEDCPDDAEFSSLDEVTWCEDKIDANSIEYVRADAAPPTAQAEPTRSQKMREAGFTARDARLTCDECGAKFTAQFASLHKCEKPTAQAEPQEPLPEFLTAQDKSDLLRIEDCFSDGEGYDLPRERMARLAELGVIRHNGGGVYSITAFGMYCTGAWPVLPLKTAAESNAEEGRLHAERMAHCIGKQEST